MLRLPRVRLIASLLLAALVLAPAAAFAERMRCASVDYRYSYCRTDRPVRWARVARRYSKRPCIEGRTWGYDRRGIWVNNGCDADFDFRMRGDRDRDRYDRYDR
jgi:Protein of unknown function (DUF3011)